MAKTTQVVFVRHAQTEMISENRIHGHTDSPLSKKGVRDAEKTASAICGQSFDAFYSSSLGRAMRTAEIIGKAINIEPTPTDGLKERFYGWLEGTSMKWFEPDLSGPKITLPLVKIALKISGESPDDFIARVTGTFDQIAINHAGQRILVVLHWGLLSVLNQHILGEDLAIWREIGPWTSCGISEYHLKNGRWQAVYIDECSHLL